jgi:hypothetical protein
VIRFAKGENAPDVDLIARTLDLPVSIIQRTLMELIDSGLVVKLSAEGSENDTYQPGKDINTLTTLAVTHALEISGRNEVPGIKEREQFLRFSELDSADCLIKDM